MATKPCQSRRWQTLTEIVFFFLPLLKVAKVMPERNLCSHCRQFSRRKKKTSKICHLALSFVDIRSSALQTVTRTWKLLKGAGKHALRSCRLWRHRLAAILLYVPEGNVSRGKVIKRWYFPRNISHLSSRNSSKKMAILSGRILAWYTLLESKGKCLSRPSISVGLQVSI